MSNAATPGTAVWLAILHAFTGVEIQVFSTAEAAEQWAVERIDRSEWAAYTASLRAQDESTPDLDTAPTPALLACWFGPSNTEPDATEYGSGLDVYLRIEKRTIR